MATPATSTPLLFPNARSPCHDTTQAAPPSHHATAIPDPGTARFFIRFSELVDLHPPRTAVNSIYQATITALPTPRHPAQSQHRLVEQQTGISQESVRILTRFPA
ncbi:hypothetical protein PtA15_5A391 [Puccinia triticina]|uniref:Uncharacterized protein n=1 Tax=Puccinia triticina TaxID=208348 RepID=A0ABY7CHX8_9BASI|nr:uncharacterized protein PtA15_5A391 [Puccinia triticina]WAQ84818.1 hypothetical protein PtA15_5A391 [Puccinia triticina]